ncbi:MAG: hypothetical protein ACTS53_01770 [Candidatus Hodgkinia cicadicola]
MHISEDYPPFEMAERRTLNAPSPYIVRLNMSHRPAKLGHKLSIAFEPRRGRGFASQLTHPPS